MGAELHCGRRGAEHLRGLRDGEAFLADEEVCLAMRFGHPIELLLRALGELARDGEALRNGAPLALQVERRSVVLGRGEEHFLLRTAPRIDQQAPPYREGPRHDV